MFLGFKVEKHNGDIQPKIVVVSQARTSHKLLLL
jgi:hypothetical protein